MKKVFDVLMKIAIVIIIIGVLVSAYIIAIEKQSISSKLIEWGISASPTSKMFSDADAYEKLLYEEAKKQESTEVISKNDIDKHGLTHFTNDAMNVYLLDRESDNKRLIIYIHGGAYLKGIDSMHVSLCARLSEVLDADVLIPLYPLAPSSNYRESHMVMEKFYLDVVNDYPEHEIILMGDSAGGGYALALGQTIETMNVKRPDHVVLLSPWLDVSMSNETMLASKDQDAILDVYGLKRAGEEWAAGDSLDNPKLSPIKGNVNLSGKITVLVGTKELFLEDCRKLVDVAKEEGKVVTLHEFSKMQHVFMLFPIPEADEAIKIIKEAIE